MQENFYPRPLRGGRLIPNAEAEPDVEFLSTPSARRATLSSALLVTSALFLSTPSARRATAGRYRGR